MVEKDGLNYVPRERSTGGRVFEHAADSHVLIHHLASLNDSFAKVPKDFDEITYFLKFVNEPVTKDGKLTAEAEASLLEEKKLEDKYQQRIFEELRIKADNIVLILNRPFIDLTMKANGKADLYFHAYFWEKYLRNLTELQKNCLGLNVSPNESKDQEEEEESGGQFIDIFSLLESKTMFVCIVFHPDVITATMIVQDFFWKMCVIVMKASHPVLIACINEYLWNGAVGQSLNNTGGNVLIGTVNFLHIQ